LRPPPREIEFAGATALALGTGAAYTAIFSAVEPVPPRARPYPNPHSIVRVWEQALDGRRIVLADPNFGWWGGCPPAVRNRRCAPPGASRVRLMQQFRAESFSLSVAGGMPAVAVTAWAVKVLRTLLRKSALVCGE